MEAGTSNTIFFSLEFSSLIFHSPICFNFSEGLKGIALAGGVALAVGGIVGLGFALAKGKKWKIDRS